MNFVDRENGDRLDSWKAIAAYLDRDEGTLRRWEQTRGLPIRRVPGRKGGSVYAFTAEIDAWLQSDPPEIRPTPDPVPAISPAVAPPAPTSVETPGRMATGAATIVVIAIGIALAGWWIAVAPRRAQVPLTIVMNEESITAKDARGRIVWGHRLGDASRHIPLQHSEPSRVVIGARPQVLVATEIQFRRADNFVEPGRLAAFGLDGAKQWEFEFDDALTIGGKAFGSPWGLTAFAVHDAGATRRIAVAAHHYTWGASLVGILDADGRRLGTYVNDGWLEALQWLAPDRLAVGGFSHSRNGGLVVLLDPANLDAQSPETDPAHRCENCGAGRPLRMAVMPRTEMNLVTGSRFNRATLEHLGDRLVVRTAEVSVDGVPASEALYEFTAGLELVAASFSDRYWEAHDKLFATQALDHDSVHCPDRRGPRSIQIWSPDLGWTVQNLR